MPKHAVKKSRHLEYVEWRPSTRRPPDLASWPYTIPAIRQLIAEGGLEIEPGVTFLVGENGSGKSTLIEAIAAKYDRRGHETVWASVVGPGSSSEDSPLQAHIALVTHRQASPAGFFLRAERMHEFLSDVDTQEHQRGSWGGRKMQEQSHGESFISVLRHRFDEVGVYFLDEPESALSFRSCLGLVALLDTMRREGSQVLVATHSPILTSLPDATLLELDGEGIRRVESYNELELVQSWRHFMSAPDRFLKHLVEPSPT